MTAEVEPIDIREFISLDVTSGLADVRAKPPEISPSLAVRGQPLRTQSELTIIAVRRPMAHGGNLLVDGGTCIA